MTEETAAPRTTALGEGRREEFGWGRIEWLADHAHTPGAELTLGHVVMQPESANARHYHPNCHELLYVIEGTIEHDLGGRSVSLEAGAVLHIPVGEPHQARNVGSEPATLLVVYSTETRETVFIDTDTE